MPVQVVYTSKDILFVKMLKLYALVKSHYLGPSLIPGPPHSSVSAG